MDKHRKDKIHKRIKVISTILKCRAAAFDYYRAAAVYLLFEPQLIDSMSSMENVNALFEHYHAESILVYIGAQILQIYYLCDSGPMAPICGRIYVWVLAGLFIFDYRRGDRIGGDLLSRQASRTGRHASDFRRSQD